MKKDIIVLSCCFVLAGCVTASPESKSSIANVSQDIIDKKFTIGKSTKKDIFLAYGEASWKRKEGSVEYWAYRYGSSGVILLIPVHTSKEIRFYFDGEILIKQEVI